MTHRISSVEIVERGSMDGGNYWEDVYRHAKTEDLPWYYAGLDADVKAAIRGLGAKRGRFLDLGTGPGTQAVGLAKLGFDVVGVDISRTAISKARARARAGNAKIRFIVDNILDTALKPKQFDFILDRGVFHTMKPEGRMRFIRTIRRLLKADGVYLMKCFSTKTPGTWGPHRFTKGMIKEYFGKYFEIVSIRDSLFQGKFGDRPKTLFCVMKPR